MTAPHAMHAAPVPRRLADLERHAGRWPVADASLSKVQLFCRERTAATKPYFARHCLLAYRVPLTSAQAHVIKSGVIPIALQPA